MLEKIKRYTQSVLNNTFACPYDTCPRCEGRPREFKRHDMRKRTFLVVLASLVHTVASFLVRFKCPLCGKTFTAYPDFALRHKRYVRDTVLEKSTQYVENEMNESNVRKKVKGEYVSYRKAVKENGHGVGYPPTQEDGEGEPPQLAHSTLYRWITSLSGLKTTLRKTLQIIEEAVPASRVFRQVFPIHPRKYQSQERRQCLQVTRQLLRADREYRILFAASVFPHFATTWAWR